MYLNQASDRFNLGEKSDYKPVLRGIWEGEGGPSHFYNTISEIFRKIRL